ncbi:SCO family protein [Flavisolibacter nicotianae]|uniref:SCO family protein n=1 Tax=Flavisolibacter nicotianae TaxID=2364882 RepID=UPI000EAE6883|nr:SCO family protein [Flavisolibacter nicotianae]
MKKYSHWLFIAIVVILPVTVYALVKWYQDRYTALPVLLEENHHVTSYALINQQGRSATLKDWDNKIVVANFFFTHCPVVCPKMVRNLKTVQAAYRNDSTLLLVSFSVDPERDSASQLHSYANRMNIAGNWLLLTGNKKEIYKLARQSFRVVATDGDGGPQDFIHSDKLVLLDRQKRIRGYYSGTDEKETERLIRDIGRLQKAE